MMITAIVLWVVAISIILVTVKNIIVRAVKIKRCSAAVPGTVIDIREKVSTRNGIPSHEYIPTILYTVDGVDYTKKFAKVYNAETYTVGKTAEVWYNPQRPSEVNKKGSRNTADIIILCIGVVIGIISIILLKK